MPELAIEALHKGILSRLSGLDKVQGRTASSTPKEISQIVLGGERREGFAASVSEFAGTRQDYGRLGIALLADKGEPGRVAFT